MAYSFIVVASQKKRASLYERRRRRRRRRIITVYARVMRCGTGLDLSKSRRWREKRVNKYRVQHALPPETR